MGTAIDSTTGLDPMTDHGALAVRTTRCHRLNCAFEAVECHGLSGPHDLECLIVVVAADITNCHQKLLWFVNATHNRGANGEAEYLTATPCTIHPTKPTRTCSRDSASVFGWREADTVEPWPSHNKVSNTMRPSGNSMHHDERPPSLCSPHGRSRSGD